MTFSVDVCRCLLLCACCGRSDTVSASGVTAASLLGAIDPVQYLREVGYAATTSHSALRRALSFASVGPTGDGLRQLTPPEVARLLVMMGTTLEDLQESILPPSTDRCGNRFWW